MAYGVSYSGSDWMIIRVKDTASGNDLLLSSRSVMGKIERGEEGCSIEEVRWAKFTGISWTHDDNGFFYSGYEVCSIEFFKQIKCPLSAKIAF